MKIKYGNFSTTCLLDLKRFTGLNTGLKLNQSNGPRLPKLALPVSSLINLQCTQNRCSKMMTSTNTLTDKRFPYDQGPWASMETRGNGHFLQ